MTPFFQRFFSLRVLGGLAACAFAAPTLMSCGGQTTTPLPNTDSGQNNGGGGGGGGAPSLAMAGAYQGTLYSSDFVSFLTPAPELNWVALYYLQINGHVAIYPDIYRGSLGNVTGSSASIASFTAYQFGDKLSVGNASISGASTSNYQIAFNGIGLTNDMANPTFTASAITSYAELPGTWTGRLTDNKGPSVDALRLNFNDAGALINSDTTYAYCPLSSLTLTTASTSRDHPYYTARLAIPSTTFCTRSPTELTGIAFIHAPSPGVKSLEIILTDSTGSGISFRGVKQ